MLKCACRGLMSLLTIEEQESGQLWGIWRCSPCGNSIGGEGAPQDFDRVVHETVWTDEAGFFLERLPPYVAPLVREEVEAFVRGHHQGVVTKDRLLTAKNKGLVVWSPEAERRLANVPASVRSMAKVELERTAVDRHLPEVTVELMEELKARYFGMAARG